MPEEQSRARGPQRVDPGGGEGSAPGPEGAAGEAFRRAEDAFCEYLLQAGLDDLAVDAAVEEWLGRDGSSNTGALEELRTQNRQLQERMALSRRGIPPEMAEKYLRLAGSYREGGAELEDALDAALRDFPVGRPGGSSDGESRANASMPSFAAPVRPAGAAPALTRAQIDAMTPRELADRWSEVEEYLMRESGEKENRAYGY